MMREESVCAVIVSYNPAPSILSNIDAVRPEVGGVIVVDNGSTEESLARLREGRSEHAFELVENGENLGIAAALNIGVRAAKAKEFGWVLLFDQDSTVTEGFVGSLMDTYRDKEGSGPIAVVCPRYIDRNSGLELAKYPAKDGTPMTSMTSGSLMPTTVFDKCGWFDEELFMDYVDIEYCLRARAEGFRIIEARDATLRHSLGAVRFYKVFGHYVVCSHHNWRRRYYITRNRVWLYRCYFRKNRPWFWQDAPHLAKDLVKIAILEAEKSKKIRSIFAGVRDGLLGHLGKTLGI